MICPPLVAELQVLQFLYGLQAESVNARMAVKTRASIFLVIVISPFVILVIVVTCPPSQLRSGAGYHPQSITGRASEYNHWKAGEV